MSSSVAVAFAGWNEAAADLGLSSAQTLTPQRRRAMTSRLSDVGEQGWSEALGLIAESPFLRGQNERGWKADIDWLLKPANLTKVLEGKYTPSAHQTAGRENLSYTSLAARTLFGDDA